MLYEGQVTQLYEKKNDNRHGVQSLHSLELDLFLQGLECQTTLDQAFYTESRTCLCAFL